MTGGQDARQATGAAQQLHSLKASLTQDEHQVTDTAQRLRTVKHDDERRSAEQDIHLHGPSDDTPPHNANDPASFQNGVESI